MPTTNPVPSTDPSDLLFNAGKLDEVVNGAASSFTDRLGVARRTVAGINADFDAQLADAESDLNVYRSDAAASAAEALGYLNDLKGRWYGALASDPTTDPTGAIIGAGDAYFNTTLNQTRVYSGSVWQAPFNPTDSSQVTYFPAGVDVVATNAQNKLRGILSPLDKNASLTDPILAVRNSSESPTSTYGVILGKQSYDASAIGAGSVIVDAYGTNRLPGTRTLRAIIAGYDNEITSGTPGDSGGLACVIVGSHHSNINNASNHSIVLGGSYNVINHGNYCVVAGTGNTLNASVTANPHNNVISGGSGNTLDGANTAIVGGIKNNVRGSSAVVGGYQHVALGIDNSAVFGYAHNISGSSSFAAGYAHTITGSDYSSIFGRNHQSTADYIKIAGRQAQATVNYGDYFGFGTGGAVGVNQRVTYPLTISTTTAAAANMATVSQGAVGIAGIVDTTAVVSAIVSAKTPNGSDYAVYELKMAFKFSSTTGLAFIYNTSTTLGNSAGAATWTCAFGNNSDSRIIVTGANGVNIKWDAVVNYFVSSNS